MLSAVLAYAPFGVARISPDLTYLEVNPRLAALLHATSEELAGSTVTAGLSPTDGAAVIQRFVELWRGPTEAVSFETRLQRAGQADRWLRWMATAVSEGGVATEYFVAAVDDATAQHEAEAAAAEHLAVFERLHKLTTDFASMVSHEVRTALTGIQGLSELIRESDLGPDEVREYSSSIFQEAERVNRLIGDMLDLSDMQGRRPRLHLVAVDINAAIRDEVELARASSPKHSIVARLKPSLPMVNGDRDRLAQVVANLLSNAVKYSPHGGEVLVTSRLDDGHVQISVRDHGIGLPADFEDRLLGRYERYEKNPSKIIGAGLGLAVAREIVELHGGRIWVDPAVDTGSEFHFTVPVGPTPTNGAS